MSLFRKAGALGLAGKLLGGGRGRRFYGRRRQASPFGFGRAALLASLATAGYRWYRGRSASGVAGGAGTPQTPINPT